MRLEAYAFVDHGTEFIVSSWVWLIYIVLIGGFIYLMMIRPNQKRAAEQKSMMDAIQPGVRVMLTSGLFGTVQAVGDQQMVVELAPGMAVTVVKPAVAKVVTEAEEEFEYTDDHEAIEGDSSEPAAIEAVKKDADEVSDEAADDVKDASDDVEAASADITAEAVEKPAEAPDFMPPAADGAKSRRTKSKN